MDRYSYGFNNPSRFSDPSGHLGKDNVVCTDDGYCGTNDSYVINAYTELLEEKFDWNLQGTSWSLDEVKEIYQTGIDISNVIGGSDRVIKLFGEVTFEEKPIKSSGSGTAHHVTLSTISNWSHWSVAHELAHGWNVLTGRGLEKVLEYLTGGHTDISQAWPSDCRGSSIAPGCNDAGYYYGVFLPRAQIAISIEVKISLNLLLLTYILKRQ